MSSKTANAFTDDVTLEEIDFLEDTFEDMELQVYEAPVLEVQDPPDLIVEEPIELYVQEDTPLSDFSDVDEQEEPSRPNSTAEDLALWMKDRLEENQPLYQADIVYRIIRIFGEQFSYTNQNGNPAITQEVLDEFKKITPEYKWSKSGFYWRKQQPGDDPKRRQVK